MDSEIPYILKRFRYEKKNEEEKRELLEKLTFSIQTRIAIRLIKELSDEEIDRLSIDSQLVPSLIQKALFPRRDSFFQGQGSETHQLTTSIVEYLQRVVQEEIDALAHDKY